MKLYEYMIENSISYDDFAYCLGCSTGYIIDIVHGRPCSKQMAEKIYDITDKKITVTATKGVSKCKS